VTAKTKAKDDQGIQILSNPDLDFSFRDFFTVLAGPEETVLEFGNLHRTQQAHVRIANRIVLSPSNTVKLCDTLNRVIQELSQRAKSVQAKSAGAAAN